jgi:S1-C subfamily serine protease
MTRIAITNPYASARLPVALAAALLLLSGCASIAPRPGAPETSDPNAIARSTVKIYSTMQADNFSNPWQASLPAQGSGTGFVIPGKRILTNAHVISNTRFLEVQKNGDPKRYIARVLYAGHDCDLAVLDVADSRFYDETSPVAFTDELPRLGDTVTAIGFPMGGTRVSITRGVVSRIDHGVYSHSAVDSHLVLQVDAAINPGNSGGPVVFNGRVAGVAFQGLSRGDNIGYAIPVPVIRHFLDDIADGVYHGYPEFGVQVLELRNPALRASLGVPAGETGVVVSWLDPFGSAFRHFKPGDVLLDIDGHAIAEDGTIDLDGNPVEFTELLERRQAGDTVTLRIFRGGSILTLSVPLLDPEDPFAFRNLYDVKPEYAVFGGLVFAPLNREILKTIRGGFNSANEQNLLYLSRYAKTDGHHLDHDAFVILIRRLPHPVNTYAESFVNGLVTSVNSIPIRDMRDLLRAFEKPESGFHVIRFAGTEDPLVLDAAAAAAAQRAILNQYSVPVASYLSTPPERTNE